jgi:hypothetical protein
MTGDEMTGDEMYQVTKCPGQNDRVRNERGQSVMPPSLLTENKISLIPYVPFKSTLTQKTVY